MCIAFVLWQSHPRYRFFLALNRDEFLSRPTLPVHWWPEQDNILAGKDLCKGGTWFGCTKNGRIALVTSFREAGERAGMISRGELVISFLKGSKAPLEYAQEVSEAGDNYNGFNILVADLCIGSMAYVSNRPRNKPVLAQTVGPGFHILCNASLNTPWPKVSRGRAKLARLVEDSGDSGIRKEQVIKELLMDDVKADRASLPQTGCTLDWEHYLSSICVDCVCHQRCSSRLCLKFALFYVHGRIGSISCIQPAIVQLYGPYAWLFPKETPKQGMRRSHQTYYESIHGKDRSVSSVQGSYGTRSMIVLAVENDGQVNLFERFLEDGCWKEHEYCFVISQEFWKTNLDV